MLVSMLAASLAVSGFAVSATACEAQAASADGDMKYVLYQDDENLTAMVEDVNSIKEYKDYTTGEYEEVKLNGDSIEYSGSGATVNGSDIVISAAGTYVLSGTLNDGAIIVDSAEEKNVALVLNGANITCKDGAPIYVKSCGKNVVLSLAPGTENTVTDGASYTYEYVTTSTDYETGEESTQPGGAIFSKADLRINGTGKLTVKANCNDGIVSKDDLEIAQATLVIDAADDGIVGKDSVAVKSGSITVKAGGDGIKSTNDEKESKGYVVIADGTFKIASGADGIQAETVLMTLGGTYDITTGGGTEAASKQGKDEFGPGGQMPQMNGSQQGQIQGQPPQMPQMNGNQQGQNQGRPPQPPQMNGQQGQNQGQPPQMPQMNGNQQGQMQGHPPQMQKTVAGADATTGATVKSATRNAQSMVKNGTRATDLINNKTDGQKAGTDSTTATEETSMKALKAGTKVLIQAGDFTINSQDDALHSDDYLASAYGTYNIQAGDDAIHADNTVDIFDGEVNITKCYEGIEGATITLTEADIDLTASDDGINASSDINGGALLYIKGGNIDVNADGDGIDINGSGYMTGGTVAVSGPTNNGNGGLDYDGEFEVTGGTLIVAGSSGMAMAPNGDTSVYTVATNVDTQQGGTEVSLVDESGKTVLSFTPEKQFSHVVISSALIEKGKTYTIKAGSTKLATFTANQVVTNLGGGQMFGPGQQTWRPVK